MRVGVRPVKSDLQGLVQRLEGCRSGDRQGSGHWRVGDPFWAEVEMQEVVLALAVFFVGGPVATLAGGRAVLRRFTSGADSEVGVCRGFGARCAELAGHCVVAAVLKQGGEDFGLRL